MLCLNLVFIGEEELNYWQKLRDDRNKKLDTKKHSKQRGRDKVKNMLRSRITLKFIMVMTFMLTVMRRMHFYYSSLSLLLVL